MINYPTEPTLANLQKYVTDKCRERGFDKASNLETFLLFAEEVGEMAKAIRNFQGLFQEKSKCNAQDIESKRARLAEEMSDVLSYLLDLSERYNIDLNSAFKAKEELNDKRIWK